MAKLLRRLTFAKGLIVVCLVGSVYLGWRAWEGFGEIQELQVALGEGGDVEDLVRKIQANSDIYTTLHRQSGGESLTAVTDPQSYIRRIANRKNIELGRIKIVARNAVVSRGIIDHQYRITPETKDATYQRVQIANFLYMLEERSNRVRVTQLKIAAPGRVDDGAYPPDVWTLDCSITSRQKEQEGE